MFFEVGEAGGAMQAVTRPNTSAAGKEISVVRVGALDTGEVA
jgi:hypothetical protein